MKVSKEQFMAAVNVVAEEGKTNTDPKFQEQLKDFLQCTDISGEDEKKWWDEEVSYINFEMEVEEDGYLYWCMNYRNSEGYTSGNTSGEYFDAELIIPLFAKALNYKA